MTEANPRDEKSFVLQKQGANPTGHPLEVYHLSHDLRGPLNSVLGFAELLLEGIEGPLNDIQIEDITAIRQSAQNLLQLINNVVDLSKLEADRLVLSFAPVDLKTIIQNISTQTELIVNLPESLPSLWGDPERVEQMILSLVNFARGLRQEGQITLTTAHDQKAVIIQITGPEEFLPPEQVEGLFELMVKVDSAGRSELGRGGLTLPLTRQLAEKHQGQVWVENREGAGTIFFLKLPVHQPK
jgi:signal transduction histidine kinase